MRTKLSAEFRQTEIGQQAQEILQRCVHCGFCLATCPTYELLGNELDSPRGRIYLIKEMLEGAPVTRTTQKHLDRCLTCRNCETTCPSGVAYGELLDIGRHIVHTRVERPKVEQLKRDVLRQFLTSRWFAPAYRLGQRFHRWLPPGLQDRVQPAQINQTRAASVSSRARHRQVVMLVGCTQPAMMPSIDAATIRVLDRLGIGTQVVSESGCCGALNFHLDAQEDARAQMRVNIDAWWPLLDSGQVEAIVMNASGCGAMVREYGHHLRLDPGYADKAREVSEKVVDVAQLVTPLAEALVSQIDPEKLPANVAFHAPCTLQHWQKLRGQTETLLAQLGMDLVTFDESHMCCGSAGAYSVLESEISNALRDRKLLHIETREPESIVSSNMGCIVHLQSGTTRPVQHWIEVVERALR